MKLFQIQFRKHLHLARNRVIYTIYIGNAFRGILSLADISYYRPLQTFVDRRRQIGRESGDMLFRVINTYDVQTYTYWRI